MNTEEETKVVEVNDHETIRFNYPQSLLYLIFIFIFNRGISGTENPKDRHKVLFKHKVPKYVKTQQKVTQNVILSCFNIIRKRKIL